MQWQVDGKPLQDVDPSVSQERSADLAKLPWKPGDRYQIRLVLRTLEADPREVSRELILRYQPPPPAVALKPPARHLFVNKPAFNVQAEIKPGVATLPVTVKLLHQQDGKDLLEPAQQAQGLKIDREVPLKPGENWIEIVARNKDALGGFEELETTRTGLMVTYTPPNRKTPPEITLEKVVPVLDDGNTPQDIIPGNPVIVHAPRLIIKGSIKATQEKLTRAEWSKARKASSALAGFTAGTQNAFTFRQEVVLEPGLQTVRILARTANSDETVAPVTIEYRPLLPRLQLLEPVQGMVFYDEGKGPPEVELKGRLVLPNDQRPFKAIVLVNDKEIPANIDNAQNLTARLPLRARQPHPGAPPQRMEASRHRGGGPGPLPAAAA